MSKISRVFVLLILTVCTVQFGAFAQNLSGYLSGILGPGTYTVVGNCEVQAGQTLTIVPGTRFEHTGNYAWTIRGMLNAVGTEVDPIEFVRQQPITNHRWKGIRFETGASSESILEWCNLDYVYTYLTGGGIYLNSVSITIRNCNVTNSQAASGGGLYANYCSNGLVIENSAFSSNTAGNGGGLYFYSCNGVVVKNCVIDHNSSTST